MDDNGGPPERWWDEVPWWTDAGLAYVKGLLDGLYLGCPDCRHLDDQTHRAATQVAIKLADRSRRDGITEGQQAA